jgi:hypothetical protein
MPLRSYNSLTRFEGTSFILIFFFGLDLNLLSLVVTVFSEGIPTLG